MRIKRWQVAVLAAPIVLIVVFLLVAAGQQIRSWRLNWIWAIVIFVLLGWRWLLVRWTRPAIAQAEALAREVSAELEASTQAAMVASQQALAEASATSPEAQIESALNEILRSAQADPPVWDDWQRFWQHCLAMVTTVAETYHPEVKRPLLNIYVPEAYGLIRGTVDDTDRVMQKLTPVLGKVSVGQMVEGVELYRKLEPSARKVMKAFNWAQWLLNPAAAIARQVSAKNMTQANQQILLNISNLLRETALRNLARQSMALYGGAGKVSLEKISAVPVALPEEKTRTLQEILEQAEPAEAIAQKPVNILLVGRTGAGKSSVINTLFQSERAAVDVLPSTDRISSYQWHVQSAASTGRAKAAAEADEAALTLWDTPGYEQADHADLREQVIDYAEQADLLLLVTPALDPALQMDADFLQDIQQQASDLPVIAVVTQVDKLRPVREWSPPYYWQTGSWPKEQSIREAVAYRAEQLDEFCQTVLPMVTQDANGRAAWGDEALATSLIKAIAPAKQLRMARFLRSRSARTTAAAQIIERYTFQMATTEGLAKLLKSPILQFISTLTTGTPALGALLIQKLPVEDAPVVLGKLQMAYELFDLFSDGSSRFDLLMLWPFLLSTYSSNESTPPLPVSQQAWALGHALVEYWTKDLPINQLEARIESYLESAPATS